MRRTVGLMSKMAKNPSEWKIRRRDNSWRLDMGTVNGKRLQSQFPTKEAAEAARIGAMDKMAKVGNVALAWKEDDLREFAWAKAKLPPGVSIASGGVLHGAQKAFPARVHQVPGSRGAVRPG